MIPSVSNNAFVGPGQGFSLIMLKTNNEPLGILGTKFSSAILVGLYRRKSRYNKLTTNAGFELIQHTYEIPKKDFLIIENILDHKTA